LDVSTYRTTAANRLSAEASANRKDRLALPLFSTLLDA
jgi:hypothetical protein